MSGLSGCCLAPASTGTRSADICAGSGALPCACMPAGIAIGGDSYPGSTLSDHCIRYQHIPAIKLIVVLGELGGQDEYSLVRFL